MKEEFAVGNIVAVFGLHQSRRWRGSRGEIVSLTDTEATVEFNYGGAVTLPLELCRLTKWRARDEPREEHRPYL